ncbi:MAG: hypothetical protein OSB41_08770 [Kiritimatiellae bacterium]|nr:hypothetical protein [Kiritimatiellia bacterium]
MTTDEAFQRLAAAHQSHRFAQGYIFAGPVQTSGANLAVRILQVLFCDSGDGCGRCVNCNKIEQRTHPDVLWVEPQKRSRIISIDQIRKLQVRMAQTSLEGGWKCAVLVGADRLGPEASNAFLKTLEEPTPNTVFLLLSENPQLMLTTIRSRCQMISLDGSTHLPEAVERELLDILLDPDVAAVQAARGRFTGSFALSEALTGMLKQIKDGIENQEADRSDSDDVESDVIKARASVRYREIRSGIMRSMGLWYRDIMVLACHGDEASVHYQDFLPQIRALAARSNVANSVRRVRVVEHMHEQMERNLQEGVVFDSGVPLLQIA